jgi:hypothetical protein
VIFSRSSPRTASRYGSASTACSAARTPAVLSACKSQSHAAVILSRTAEPRATAAASGATDSGSRPNRRSLAHSELPPLARAGLAGGAIFAVAWASLCGRALYRGTWELRV